MFSQRTLKAMNKKQAEKEKKDMEEKAKRVNNSPYMGFPENYTAKSNGSED